ncbi:MAG: PAS domain S-box protein [Syntrophobacteraceae bacterium]
MFWDRTNRPVWLRFTVGVLVVVAAAAVRLQFLGVLELHSPFLTFYPAVAIAALYGGFGPGLLATVVSAALADYFWIEPVGQFGIANATDLISMVIFLASCALISYLAEAAYRAQARAHKAEELSKLSAEREKAEALLKRQAELLHLSYDAIVVWRRGGPIETWNKGAEELYGYSQEEAVGRVTHDLLKTIHPEPWPQIEAKLREHKFWEGEHRHLTREGREVIVSARHQLVSGADGVERVLEINRDITERKRAEEELRRSREWLGTTLSSIGDGVIAADASGNVSFLNPVAAALTGWQSEDAIGQPIQSVFQVINENTREPAENIVERVMSDGNIVNLANHTALITREGREIPIEDSAAPIKDSTGKIIGVVLVFHDVTEKRRIREALRESEEHYRSLFDNILNGYAYCRMLFKNDQPEDFVYLNVNSAFENLTGLKNVIGKKVSEVIPGIRQSDPELLEIYGRVARTGVPERFETYVEALGMWFSISVYGPREEHFVAVFDVITERKRMEDELRKSRDQLELRVHERTAELNGYMAKLEQSNQALQDFASIASHDLKEPLRKVISFGNMLRQKSGESLGQSGNDYLNRMLNATERMQSLLGGLLDYSRVTTAAEPFEAVDLSDLIGEVLSDLEIRIVRTGGEVHVEDLPVISADPTQLRQLFQNLIGNALKFHKPGEKPMVQVRSISNTDSGCQIVVEDNGIGFEEKYLDRIFAPFQRLHARSEYEGTGMGLAICKKIVDRHGWSITAKSTPGAGSTFIIQLP